MSLRRLVVLAAVIMGFGLTFEPGVARADLASDAVALPDRGVGKADAPVTIIEYAALTCSHCADFQKETFEKINTNYIEKGKVRLIFRDFPIDGVGLRVAAMARCMPEENYHTLIGILFKNQGEWAVKDDPVHAASQFAKLGGLNEADAKACAENEKLMDALTAGRQKATDEFKVEATPTFIVLGPNGAQEKIAGALPYDKFSEVLDTMLAHAKK